MKRNGKLKGRTCANGIRQNETLSDGESIASPTQSLEGLLMTYAIAVHEGRYIAGFDVPGAYLHAETPEDKMVIMKIKDRFVDIMCSVNPEYKQHVRHENGRKVLYVKVLRAI